MGGYEKREERSEEKIRRAMDAIINQAVLSKKEVEEILNGSDIDGSVFNVALPSIRDSVLFLISLSPRISEGQSKELLEDIEQLFQEWEKPALSDKPDEDENKLDSDVNDASDPSLFFKKKLVEIKRLIRSEFSSERMNFSRDIKEEITEKMLKVMLGDILADNFGQAINELSQDEKLRLDIAIEKSIENNIDRFF